MISEEQLAYGGVPHKPGDFDAYWDAAVSESRSDGDRYTLEPADFAVPGVECFWLWFTGLGGARICCKLLRPVARPGKKHPALCLFHGYSGNSGDWSGKLAYALSGFTVLAMDTRGQSGRSEDNLTVQGTTWMHHYLRGLTDPDPRRFYCRGIFTDAAKAARIVLSMEDVDPTRVYASGFSQGGDLTVACAALEPRVSRIAFGGVASADCARYVRELQTTYATAALAPVLLKYFNTEDPYRENEAAIIERFSYIDLILLAPRIRAQTQNYIGLRDSVCPAPGQLALYNHIAAPKSLYCSPDGQHAPPPDTMDRLYAFFCRE
jgi:cephalosporin-C deacetylase